MSSIIRLALAALCCAPLACAEANLLKNATLETAAGKVAGWRGSPAGAETDATDLPSGVAAAVKIVIIASDDRSHGQLTQRIAVTTADARYRVSAWTKAGKAKAAYVQVKLYGADRTELKRITIGHADTAWTQIDQVVDASGASAIEVLLRWIPDAKFDRTPVWFAVPSLSETDAPAAQEGKPRADAGARTVRTLALVGDSTVQSYPERSERRGWGEMLGAYLAPDVQILNRAAGGRSTATFRSEGRWERVLAERPDAVLIQFGHNDSHEPGRPESTDAASTYPGNLRLYVAEARAAGIAVVLITPPARRVFNSDGISTVFRPYVAAMRAVATETGTPCIDLYASASSLLHAHGETASIALFSSEKDRSHFSAAGAQAMARLVAEGLLALDDSTRSLLRPSDQWPTAAMAVR